MDNIDIEKPKTTIFELDESPRGVYKLRKRLSLTEYAGDKIYELYEWAPMVHCGKPDEYMQTYGTELSENILKETCRILRKELFDMYQDEDPDDIVESDEIVDISDLYDDDDDNDEDFPVPQFESEMQCSLFMDYKKFESGIWLTAMSWGEGADEISGFDIRQWEMRINRIGDAEYVPIINKGVTLDMYEAELFCQAVESLFPELVDELVEYRDEEWDEKQDTIDLNLSREDKDLALFSLCNDMQEVQKDFCNRLNRGSTVGASITEERQYQVQKLIIKIENGERLTDEEILLCSSFFESTIHELKEHKEIQDNKKLSDGLTFLTKRFDNAINNRDMIFSEQQWKTQRTNIDVSVGEGDVASDVLVLIRQLLYVEENVTPQKIAEIKNDIDAVVLQDIAERNAYQALDASFQENPGLNFIDDLILAFLFSTETK